MYQRELFRHEWRRTIRSTISAQSVAIMIFWAIYFLFVGVSLFIFGLFFPIIIKESFPALAPMQIMTGLIPFLMLAGLVIRLFLQPLNYINENYYRQLPIPRKAIAQYLIFRPLANPINYYVFVFLFLPYSIVTGIEEGAADFAVALVTLLMLTLTDMLLAPYLKRILGDGLRFYIIVIGAIALMLATEITGFVPWSDCLFRFVSSLPVYIVWICMASILAGTYIASQRYFRQHRYAKERTKSNSTERYHNLNFVRQHGIIGEVIALHIKLILRSKRLRSTFIFSFLFILYGLLFYRESNADTMTAYVIIANIIVSSLMLMQQQFVIRWDCAFFDGLMAQAITSRTYIRSHYIILMILNAASFILSTPYFLMGEEIVYLHISLFLWNSGIGTIFILLMACFNKGYIEVMSRSVMNQQGTSMVNILIALPTMMAAPVLLVVLKWLTDTRTAEITIGLIGLIVLMMHKPLLNFCTRVFSRQKHALAESFRERK